MTREEFLTLAKAMTTMFPDMNLAKDPEAMEIWFAMMGDIDYRTASMALQAHVNTSPYPPKVVDFRRFANRQKTEGLNEEEAWALVTKAVRNGAYGAEEEFAKLPDIVQKAVGSPVNLEAWSQLPSDEVHTVVSSNFMRQYRTETEKASKETMVSDALRIEENTMGRIDEKT